MFCLVCVPTRHVFDELLSFKNILQFLTKEMIITEELHHILASAGQNCVSCGYFTVNFDPASIKHLLGKASIMCYIA